MFKKSLYGYAVCRHRWGLTGAMLGLLVAFGGLLAGHAQAAPVKVVASFSILGDMVSEIGGEHVVLTTIVGVNGDVHAFEPAPKDAKALKEAQLLVVNGIGFEAWLPRLLKSSGFKGLEVVASKGITPRMLSEREQHNHAATHKDGHDESKPETIDPHAWQSLTNGMIYAQNIADGLARVDPGNAVFYQNRARHYIAQMKKLDIEIKQALSAIPVEQRKVVTSHDSFGYFGRDYDVEFISIMGLSNDAEPSAKELAAIVDLVKKNGHPAIFIESVTSPKLIQQLARETGAKVGGTLYSDALAALDEPAGSYLGLFKWNAGQLIYALKP